MASLTAVDVVLGALVPGFDEGAPPLGDHSGLIRGGILALLSRDSRYSLQALSTVSLVGSSPPHSTSDVHTKAALLNCVLKNLQELFL